MNDSLSFSARVRAREADAGTLAAQTVTWRDVARAAFATCRSADEVRRAFGRLWSRLERASPDELAAVSDEFQAALRRCGAGV